MAEILTCPSCRRQLQVPENFIGQTVQCPECRHQFIAAVTSVSAQPVPTLPMEAPDPPPRPRRRDDDEDELADRLRRRGRFADDDDEDGLDFGRRRGRHYEAHRGNLILALGLLSLVGGLSFCLPALLGPVAWIMGSMDLREIRAGRMDPEGESMTRSGQVCGMVASICMILAVPCLALVFLG